MTPRVAVVGAQFGDPLLFMRWLHESFEVSSRQIRVGEHDRVHEIHVLGSSPVRLDVAVPAHWKPDDVYEYVFRDRPDAVLVVLTALQRVQQTNAMAIRWAQPHFSRFHLTPLVIVNDAHGRHPDFPTLGGARVCSDHGVPWPARETMIGNFDGPKLRWIDGAEETWNLLLEAAKQARPSEGE